MNVSVIGLGYIGLPTAIALAMNGSKVKGFDVSEGVVRKLNAGQIHIVEEGLQPLFEQVLRNRMFQAYDTLQESDIYIISVPTPFKEGTQEKIADLSYVEQAARSVAGLLKEGDLVILESTVPPTTTRTMTDILEQESGIARDRFYTAHCPERVLPGNIMYEMQHNDRIIGAEREESAQKAKALYETFLTKGNIFLTDDVMAELCKLVENSYRDVNIAFANELSMICNKLQIDTGELIRLANRHPRVNILSPGVGVGGHCLAVDPYFIVERFPQETQLIHAARTVNDFKPHFLAEKIACRLGETKDRPVTILGMSYKPDIDDFRESPSVVLAKDLQDRGYLVRGCDPNIKEKTVEGIPMISLEQVLSGPDFLVLAQRHKEFIERGQELEAADCLCV